MLCRDESMLLRWRSGRSKAIGWGYREKDRGYGRILFHMVIFVDSQKCPYKYNTDLERVEVTL